MNSNINPATKGAIANVVKSIVCKTEFMFARRSFSVLETTIIQSFSRMILDPIQATWFIDAKTITIEAIKSLIHDGQSILPTLKLFGIVKNVSIHIFTISLYLSKVKSQENTTYG